MTYIFALFLHCGLSIAEEPSLEMLPATNTETSTESQMPSDLKTIQLLVPEATLLWSDFDDPRGKKRHRAIDIKAKTGAQVLAPLRGVVTGRGTHSTAGLWLEVLHDGGIMTRYLHLSRFEKNKGDTVEEGESIGRVGDTGNAKRAGPHLHFEWVVNKAPIDPMPLLRNIVRMRMANQQPNKQK